MAPRRFGLWSSALAFVIVIGLVVAGASYIGLRLSRDELTKQAQHAERTLADERAHQVDAALDQAEDRLEALTRQPIFASTFSDENRDRLRNFLTGASRLPAVAGYTAYDANGQRLMEAKGGDHPAGTLVRFESDVLSSDGSVAGRLAVAISVPALVPSWASDGSVVLVRRDGRIVVGAASGSLDSTALLDTVRRGAPAVLTYSTDDGSRVAAVAPVGQSGLAVIASQPQAQANAAAHRLTVRLLSLLAACLLTLAVVAYVLARIVHRMRVDIEAERAAAERLAVTDPLTGLANRRGLEHAVASTTETLTIAAIDLDGLKALNDTLGHAAGDAALRDMANALRASVRPGDVVARTGGDEFVVVSMGGDGENSLRERLRVAIGGVGPLSASLGVASGDPTDYADILARADRRCYDDKRSRKGVPI